MRNKKDLHCHVIYTFTHCPLGSDGEKVRYLFSYIIEINAEIIIMLYLQLDNWQDEFKVQPLSSAHHVSLVIIALKSD